MKTELAGDATQLKFCCVYGTPLMFQLDNDAHSPFMDDFAVFKITGRTALYVNSPTAARKPNCLAVAELERRHYEEARTIGSRLPGR